MSHRIVVCDDEVHITRAISMKLSKAGFEVEAVPDGQAAWETICRETPALLITDYQMPRMNGLELVRRVRETAATRDLPVFLLTAKGYELDENQMKQELGVAEMIFKPFSPRELLRCVEQQLGVTAATV
jgi:DNA-binding response OmpR family regulator